LNTVTNNKKDKLQ